MLTLSPDNTRKLMLAQIQLEDIVAQAIKQGIDRSKEIVGLKKIDTALKNAIIRNRLNHTKASGKTRIL